VVDWDSNSRWNRSPSCDKSGDRTSSRGAPCHPSECKLCNSGQTRRSAASIVEGKKILSISNETYLDHPDPGQMPRVCELDRLPAHSACGIGTPIQGNATV
jgi:hypothetical protein